jgi:integrase
MDWEHFKGNTLVTRIIQAKTGQPVTLTLHPIAKAIMEKRKSTIVKIYPKAKVFCLPSADGCNKILKNWIKVAGIEKYITWSCARLSFSIHLKDRNIDDPTIAYLMGHTTTDQVQRTYKRHRLYIAVEKDTILQLKMLPLQRVNNPSLCSQKRDTKDAGRGNKSSDHITLFQRGIIDQKDRQTATYL